VPASPDHDPLFSVLIATYDRPAYLAEAVSSVLDQTIEDFECIVVDDAGPTPAEAGSDPRVRVVRRATNGGQSAAYNTGLAAARGRYVTFLDDDDLYTPDRLAMTLEGFARAPVVICQSCRFGEDRSTPHLLRTLEGDVGDVIREQLTPNIGQTAVERAEMIPFDERLRASADVEWWIRMAQQARVTSVGGVGLVRRLHSEGRHGNDHPARVDALMQILDIQADYFAAHPRAAAFQWQRIGVKALRIGDHRTALKALGRSFVRRPERHALVQLGRATAASGRALVRPRRRTGTPG
jgi:glycosyltransferase involved in cell wall biosynthesis